MQKIEEFLKNHPKTVSTVMTLIELALGTVVTLIVA